MHCRLAPWLALLTSFAVAQTPRVTVEGRVVEVDGTPIAGATIGVLGGEPKLSDADGRFSIAWSGRVMPSGGEQLVLAARDRVSYRIPLSALVWKSATRGLLGDQLVELGDVRLPRGVNFRGRVRSASGAPLAGVRIVAIDELTTHAKWQSGWGGVVASQDDGRFVLSGVFDRAMGLVCEADGYYREVVRAAAIESPLDLRLEPSGFVTGPLPTDAGQPFDGWLRIHGEFLNEELGRVRVRGERYSIGVPTRGRFRVLGMRSAGEIAWQSDVLSGPKEGVVLHELERGADRMRLRAVDAATGKPIEPVRASVNWWIDTFDRDRPDPLLAALALASPSASPSLPLPVLERDAGVVAVAAEGYASVFEPVSFVKGGEVVVRLVPAKTITGTVVDAQGAPVAGCLLGCRPGNRKSRALPQFVRSAKDGTFAFHALTPEEFTLRSEGAPGSATGTARCDVRERSIDGLRFEIPAGESVSGVVQGIEIQPGYRILLLAASGRSVAPEVSYDPDPWSLDGVLSAPLSADGSFELTGCVHGDARLALFVPASPRRGAPMRLPIWAGKISGTTSGLVIDAAQKRPATLVGKVKAPDAALASGRLVVLAREVVSDRRGQDQLDFETSRALARMRWRLVGGDGSYELALPPGQHSIELVDCVTGIALTRAEDRETIELKPGERRSHELASHVVEVEVRFVVEGGGRALVDHLAVGSSRPSPVWQLTVFGGGTFGSPGVFVEGRSQSATFYASPGPLELGVHCVSALEEDGAQLGDLQGKMEVEVGKGPTQVVDMHLPRPLELGGPPK